MTIQKGMVGGNLLPGFEPKREPVLPAAEPVVQPQPTEPPTPDPPKVEPPVEPDFNARVKELFGFEPDALKSEIASKKDLEKSLEEMRGKVIDDPLILHLKNEIESGANPSRVKDILEFRSLNVDELSEIDAIKKRLSLETKLSADEINAFVEENYLEEDGEKPKAVKVAIEGKQAKEWLKLHKAQFEPKPPVDNTKIKEGFATIGNAILKDITTINVKFQNIENLGDYAFDYPVSLDEAEQKGIQAQLVEIAMQAGLQLNEDAAGKLNAVARKMVETTRAAKIQELIVRDVAAKVAESMAKKYAGDPNPPAGSPPKVETPKVVRPKGYY